MNIAELFNDTEWPNLKKEFKEYGTKGVLDILTNWIQYRYIQNLVGTQEFKNMTRIIGMEGFGDIEKFSDNQNSTTLKIQLGIDLIKCGKPTNFDELGEPFFSLFVHILRKFHSDNMDRNASLWSELAYGHIESGEIVNVIRLTHIMFYVFRQLTVACSDNGISRWFCYDGGTLCIGGKHFLLDGVEITNENKGIKYGWSYS